MLDVAWRAHFYQLRNLLDQLGLVHIRADGQVHLGVFQKAVLKNRSRVNRRPDELQRQRYEVARDDGFQQVAQHFVEFREARSQVFVIVKRQVARLHAQRKGGERGGQGEHHLEQPFRMAAPRLEQVAESREVPVDG